MNDRFLRFYNDELRYIREMGQEFGRAFPKIAGRLGLDTAEVSDPYVERLLEGFAFLAARIQLKLDARFPAFTQHLLELIYPHHLAPTPAMGIARFEPDREGGRLEKGYLIPRGTALIGQLAPDAITQCEFRTAQDVHLWPIAVTGADYFATPSELAGLSVNTGPQTRAALRLRLRTTNGLAFDRLAVKSLRFYLPPAGGTGGALIEQMLADLTSILARPAGPMRLWNETIPAAEVRHVGLDDDEALLPFPPRSFTGYRTLQEYFAMPERALFVEVGGLADAVRRCDGEELELIFLLRRSEPRLQRALGRESFVLFASPVVNLFERQADRIRVSDRAYEHHLAVDRTRPLDIEVHSVLSVQGEHDGGQGLASFRPFYAVQDFEPRNRTGAYYTIRREQRLPSSRQQRDGQRTSYLGSEVFLSIVDAQEAPYRSDLRQLAVRCLCTNRDLALLMPVGRGDTDFTLEIGAPVARVRCISGPTRPRPAAAEAETAWHLISHLSLNYLSLADSDGGGPEALRSLFRLYADPGDASALQQIDGLRALRSRPVVRRLPTGGLAAVARGMEIEATLDENAFEGLGSFAFGAVLSRFFAQYVSINSFAESVIHTLQRGETMRWPMRLGRRPLA
ncbi:type VI secretion system baseplate subunit TssF [Arenibaculum pallidiluteum]|uniref:type VI secretion system baseplate subunit TssF n=1 Tax=Arenibaculum pallidiluteum TaxID=2812559 RepID=UPI001A96359C|nr:type VI secretion system baseplate subunit TssF [Arenibaculum pallidiluteum]